MSIFGGCINYREPASLVSVINNYQPAITSTTPGATYTFTSLGRYIHLGNAVLIQMEWTVTASAGGPLDMIVGIPLVSIASTNPEAVLVGTYTPGGGNPQAIFAPIKNVTLTTNAVIDTAIPGANLVANGVYSLSGIYLAK